MIDLLLVNSINLGMYYDVCFMSEQASKAPENNVTILDEVKVHIPLENEWYAVTWCSITTRKDVQVEKMLRQPGIHLKSVYYAV